MNSPETAIRGALAFLFILVVSPGPASAATTISAVNSFSYGANIGWLDWRGDANLGAVVGSYVCHGYIYSGTIGWINLGGDSPANRIQYQNNSATDFGVNLDDSGNLRGYAYAVNIGWINFENLGAPRIDLQTGRFSGSCYSANCGWISLSNAFAHVQTDVILPGADADGDGLADAWELLHFGTLAHGAGSDADGDGASDLQEYSAGTNPNDPNSLLVITAYTNAPQGTSASLTWQSVLSRHYFIEQNLDLGAPLWFDSGLGLIPPDGGTTTRLVGDTAAPRRFLRVRAVTPLSP
jgi:hypothetical protein